MANPATGTASVSYALELASRLRREADEVLQYIGLENLVHPLGGLTATGSYFLDVMVYPDIDLYIPTVSIEQLFSLARQLAECEKVRQVIFEKSTDPTMPGGFYLKPRIEHGQWGRPWKIDIWSIDPSLIEQKMEPMWRFKQALTESLRAQIIMYKMSILTREGRTPMYSGYFIYKAFLDEKMTDFDQVTSYLVQNGIAIGQAPAVAKGT